MQINEEMLKCIADSTAPVSHAVSTSKIGSRVDEMAVLDAQARVFRAKGLRVVDASTFRLLPPRYSQATVCALVERVVSLILGGEQ